MGSVGSAVSKSTSLVGQDVSALDRYTGVGGGKAIKEDFNLDFATESQIDAIRGVFKGMQEYDKGYDENHTPYKITDISVRRVMSDEDIERYKLMGMREYKDIQLSIRTEPQSESAYIRMADEKYRHAIIGARGGYYTYDKNSRRKTISSFDIRYGTRSL